ncbi:MAG: tetratricopeptide repeat protein [Pyrinomonadaceae bacterium]
MWRGSGVLLLAIAVLALPSDSRAQQEEICSDRGIHTESESPLRRPGSIQIVFGRVTIKRPKGTGKPPSVVVWLREGRSTQRFALDGSGSYCFEKSAAGGEITVDINGQQADRRSIITNLPEQREDFEFNLTSTETPAPPGVVSAKFNYKRNSKNEKLYEKALRASAEQQPEKAIEYLTAVATDDPADYIANATLASIYYRQKNYSEAGKWFKRSIEINPEYSPAWLSLSQSQYAQKEYDAAIESCKKLLKLEPKSAVGFYILGEAYLRTEKGNLAVEALNEAIKLDPVGMAECHLILADLYDINDLKKLASKEYKAFIAKVPNHPDRQRIEKYISDNPE